MKFLKHPFPTSRDLFNDPNRENIQWAEPIEHNRMAISMVDVRDRLEDSEATSDEELVSFLNELRRKGFKKTRRDKEAFPFKEDKLPLEFSYKILPSAHPDGIDTSVEMVLGRSVITPENWKRVLTDELDSLGWGKELSKSQAETPDPAGLSGDNLETLSRGHTTTAKFLQLMVQSNLDVRGMLNERVVLGYRHKELSSAAMILTFLTQYLVPPTEGLSGLWRDHDLLTLQPTEATLRILKHLTKRKGALDVRIQY